MTAARMKPAPSSTGWHWTCPRLRPLHFSTNQGAAAALNAAIAATKGDWVLLLDSDGQFPIRNLPAMLEALRRSGGLAAIGIRQKKDVAFARFGSRASGDAVQSWRMAASCVISIPPLNWYRGLSCAGSGWKPKA